MARKSSRRKRKNKWDKWFLLSWKRFLWIILAWFAAVILHNLVSALLGIEEAVFFIIAVIILPLYLIISVIYSLVKSFKS